MTNLLDQQQEFRRIVDEAKREGKLLSVPEEYSCVGVPGVGSLQPGTQCWSSGVPLISQQPWHPGIVRVKWEQRHLLTKLEWPQVRVIAVRPVYGYAYGPHAHDEFYHAPATDGGPSFQGFDLRIESPYCTPKVPYEQMYVENIDQFLDRLPKEGP